jgi:hypothetical protein
MELDAKVPYFKGLESIRCIVNSGLPIKMDGDYDAIRYNELLNIQIMYWRPVIHFLNHALVRNSKFDLFQKQAQTRVKR